MNEAKKVKCQGSCHCKSVRYEVQVPVQITARKCNCSICAMTGFVHVTVDREDLKLLSGKDDLREYRFNTGTAKHLFCRHCGVKSFYVPRSRPDGYSINLNCLDVGPEIQIRTEHFDGQHWRKNIHKIRDES